MVAGDDFNNKSPITKLLLPSSGQQLTYSYQRGLQSILFLTADSVLAN